MTSATETWPASLRGVPLPWSFAMRTLGVAIRVGGQHQQQFEAFGGKISELYVVVKGQHASILYPEMKEKQGVKGVRAPRKEVDKRFQEWGRN